MHLSARGLQHLSPPAKSCPSSNLPAVKVSLCCFYSSSILSPRKQFRSIFRLFLTAFHEIHPEVVLLGISRSFSLSFSWAANGAKWPRGASVMMRVKKRPSARRRRKRWRLKKATVDSASTSAGARICLLSKPKTSPTRASSSCTWARPDTRSKTVVLRYVLLSLCVSGLFLSCWFLAAFPFFWFFFGCAVASL